MFMGMRKFSEEMKGNARLCTNGMPVLSSRSY